MQKCSAQAQIMFLMLRCMENRPKNTVFQKSAPAAGVPPAESSASGDRHGSLAPTGLART